ncbi:kinase-like domain-containing protein [Zychaea mexicana]|uniref:kinase-like domain-containing protein n=1 Tax=Zychaea mexicana TaxID=64656 RepID=UPI0022FE5BC4|nr:kinase-like domain-containing protein [Zychaea mexicana]KAI9489645.1 kinase-like domain-containing protein [Zychaea mexicana]
MSHLLQHGIITPEPSMPSSPTLSPAVVSPTTATNRHVHSNDDASNVDLTELTRLLQKAASSRSTRALHMVATKKEQQRPKLSHRNACAKLPPQFIFKRPEYNELYHRTHFHHYQHHINHSTSSSSINSNNSSCSSSIADDTFGNHFRQDIEGRYGKWGRFIGKGAGGSVRLIQRSEADSKPVAVKQFRKRLPHETDKDYIKKVTAEFCIGSTLHHPNVIKTLDMIQDGPHFYEIMEYCPNDLFNVVKSGMMSREEMVCCWRQLLNGLEYLHGMGIAHRDLKLDNLVLDQSGMLKIIDFGCSCVFKYPFENTIVMSRGILGSDPYIAPEQYTQQTYDPRQSDVWSCAIIFFCMIIARFPWRVARPCDRAFRAFATNHNQQQFRMLKLLPREARPIMASLLDLDPSRRPTLKQVLQDNWVQKIDVCSLQEPGAHHVHHVYETTPAIAKERGNVVVITNEPPGVITAREKRKQQQQQQSTPQQAKSRGTSSSSSSSSSGSSNSGSRPGSPSHIPARRRLIPAA